jgi:hypothetical protein
MELMKLDFTISTLISNQTQQQPSTNQLCVSESLNIETSNTVSINDYLNNSSVYVNYTGKRILWGQWGSIELDRMIERLEVICTPTLLRPLNEEDRRNGIECVQKIRTLYRESDRHLFGMIWNIFDSIIGFCYLPYDILNLLYSYHPVQYAPRASIDVDPEAIYSIGPVNIEQCLRQRVTISDHSTH